MLAQDLPLDQLRNLYETKARFRDMTLGDLSGCYQTLVSEQQHLVADRERLEQEAAAAIERQDLSALQATWEAKATIVQRLAEIAEEVAQLRTEVVRRTQPRINDWAKACEQSRQRWIADHQQAIQRANDALAIVEETLTLFRATPESWQEHISRCERSQWPLSEEAAPFAVALDWPAIGRTSWAARCVCGSR